MVFALFGMLASFGIGNMVQANSVADAISKLFSIQDWIIGVVLMILTGVVILGGIRRIAEVAARLVPIMAIAYFTGALLVIALNFQQVPTAMVLIFSSAFTETAATGGFAGATVWAALRFGIARGVFSNEAGLGSAPIAHAAAKTTDPVRQGMIAMLGTFIDTLLICTMTALVIILSGAWNSGETGAALSMQAFSVGLPGEWGSESVVFGLAVFAFTTILGWSYYGERCAEFLFGIKVILPYRLFWLAAIPVGAMGKLGLIWLLADIMNGLMAIPNLIGICGLSGLLVRETKEFLADMD
jgi:AGCS family alanine or glycine:cation symporter